MTGLEEELRAFVKTKRFQGKGPLCVALIVTEHARKQGLPLDPGTLVTDGGGQVYGLGKAKVQAILKRHGIERVLANEGGRTSRGSLGNMREYAALLNALQTRAPVDLQAVEAFWIARVEEFFAAKPFRIRIDAACSVRHVVRGILSQAVERQKDMPGVQYAGAVLQHLVGAKLECVLGVGVLQHHSFSTADAPSGRNGDFFIGDVAIHVTTSPSEGVIARCHENLEAGWRPLLVTLQKGAMAAEVMADNQGLAERIDIFEVEQFVAANLYELGRFDSNGRRTAALELVNRYNAIVEAVETDPSLRIDFKA